MVLIREVTPSSSDGECSGVRSTPVAAPSSSSPSPPSVDEGDGRSGDEDDEGDGGARRRRLDVELGLDAAEAGAGRAVSDARAVVEALREYDGRSAPLDVVGAGRSKSRSRAGESSSRSINGDCGGGGYGGGGLVSHLRSLGLVLPPETDRDEDGDDDDGAGGGHGGGGSAGDDGDERTALVRRVLLPRVRALATSYSHLDRLLSARPGPTPQPARADDDRQGPRRRKRGGAPPPRGLLSLSDYTDVACLLELLVCASVLPNLDDDVLHPAAARMKMLPRSLAGRVPRRLVSASPLFRSGGARAHFGGGSAERDSRAAAREAARELRDSADAIGELCSLDRFRPMLLPRHLADVYAAWFQADHLDGLLLQSHSNLPPTSPPPSRLSNPRVGIGTEELLMPWRDVDDAAVAVPVVDNRAAVPALRRLLLFGRTAPRWIKVRVNSALADVARRDLFAVMDAFVTAAGRLPGADVSAAAARLATALVTSPPSIERKGDEGGRYLRSICDQLVLSLDGGGGGGGSVTKNGDGAADPGPITAAAVLALLPPPHRRYLLSKAAEGLVAPRDAPAADGRVAAAVGRIRKLVRAGPAGLLPPGANTACRSLAGLGDGDGDGDEEEGGEWGGCLGHGGGGGSVLGGLLAVAANAPLAPCAGGAVDAAVAILDGLIASSSSSSSSSSVRRDAAVCLMRAVTMSDDNEFDGRPAARFRPSSDGGCELAVVGCGRNGLGEEDAAAVAVSDLQNRAAVAVRISRMLGRGGGEGASGQADSEGGVKRPKPPLSADLFRLLLSTYLNSLSAGGDPTAAAAVAGGTVPPHTDVVDPAFLGRKWGRTAALAVLATLLDECGGGAPDELLGGGDDDEGGGDAATGVFGMIGSVLSASATSVASTDGCPGGTDGGAGGEGRDERLDALLSTCSVCLGLLVALLELGNPRRSVAEEEIIRSLAPDLERLARWSYAPSAAGGGRAGDAGTDAGAGASEAAGRIGAEMGEMAAHACALVAARGCRRPADDAAGDGDGDEDVEAGAGDHDREESSFIVVIARRIRSVEVDLGSDMPPVRARGVVALLRIARAVTEARDDSPGSGGGVSAAGPLIVEVDNGDLVASDDSASFPRLGEERSVLADRLLEVALVALDDDESYVYLAAVQALSAIADCYPEYVMPLLATALSRGTVPPPSAVKNNVGDELAGKRGASGGREQDTYRLSPSQRVKVAEALLLAIRRRGGAIGHHAKPLLGELVRGCAARRGDAASSSTVRDVNEEDASTVARKIQRQTDSYFMNGTTEESTDYAYGGKPLDEDYSNDEDAAEERQLRLRAGGPLFAAEEDDAIRSGCYSCLAELLMMLPTTMIAPHGFRIVRLCMESLRLDVSRPVRRGAALLARELYESIVREAGEDVDTPGNRVGNNHLLLPLTVAVVSSGEAHLRSTLEQCINRTGDAVADRYHDPSTTARCREALEARNSADERGLFSLAALLVKERSREPAASRSVRELLSGGETKGLGGSVQAMSSLMVDADTLALG